MRWCCPNRLLATGERIDGLSLGGRQLLALRLAVEKLAGSEAVSKMTVLLHLAEEMEEPVLAELRAHNLYGSVSLRPLYPTKALMRLLSLLCRNFGSFVYISFSLFSLKQVRATAHMMVTPTCAPPPSSPLIPYLPMPSRHNVLPVTLLNLMHS